MLNFMPILLYYIKVVIKLIIGILTYFGYIVAYTNSRWLRD